MSNYSPSPVGRLVGDAGRRVDACRTALRELLAGAQRDYREALSELETLGASPSDAREVELSARVEALQRSQRLHETATELDQGILRLNEALGSLDEAMAALEGRIVRLGPSEEPLNVSVEAVAIQAQEEERYRLAREIHDGPAQILANVALQLEYISKLATKDSVRARDEMVTIQKDLRLAVGEVRRFMYDLRPPALAQLGVGPAIESHCQRVAERFGIQIDVDWQASVALPASHDTAVFRITQEALQNVVKHSQATRVEVRAAEREGALEISVADNGRGFTPERAQRLDPQHFGMTGMRARAQQIGAFLEVSSTPGRGTTVLLRIPVG